MAELVRMTSIKVVPRSASSSSSSSSTLSSSPVEGNPQESWLPITASRNGNLYRSVFHLLNSGIGIQALSVPVAFSVLGFYWGSLWMSIGFAWQLYTIWLLIHLHESVPGTRFSRYMQLAMAAFGIKLGKLLALFPLGYLSGGTCVTLTITAGNTIKLFFQIVCGPTCKSGPLTVIEWYLVFVIIAILIAQQPSLNSIAGISLVGAVAAFSYCTLVWVTSISRTRPADLSYDPSKPISNVDKILTTFNAIGIVILAFRGHNLVLEIQGTLPSSEEKPSRVPMWQAAKFAYSLIALCLYPLGIAVFWAYGNKIQHANGKMPRKLHELYGHDYTSRAVLASICVLIVIYTLSSFQVYAMPIFDNLQFVYIRKKKAPCPPHIRFLLRVAFGCVVFFISVALPFITNLAGLVGGITLPVTLVYPCFMWIAIKKPPRWSVMWIVNSILGGLGVVLSVLVAAGGVWTLVHPGVYVRFFKP